MSVKSFKFVSPGVFINEIDNSFIPKSANAIGPVVVGRATRGLAMTPVKVESYSQFVEMFGSTVAGNGGGDIYRDGNYQSPMYGTYAAKAFLNANVAPLTFVRLLGEQHNNYTAGSGENGWKTTKNIAATLKENGGAYGLWIFPSSSNLRVFGSLGTASLAAVLYANSSSAFRLSGALAGTTSTAYTNTTAALGAVIKSDSNNLFTVEISSITGSSTVVEKIKFGFDDTQDNFIRNVFNTNPQLSTTPGSFYPAASYKPYWLGETFEQELRDGVNVGAAASVVMTAVASGDQTAILGTAGNQTGSSLTLIDHTGKSVVYQFVSGTTDGTMKAPTTLNASGGPKLFATGSATALAARLVTAINGATGHNGTIKAVESPAGTVQLFQNKGTAEGNKTTTLTQLDSQTASPVNAQSIASATSFTGGTGVPLVGGGTAVIGAASYGVLLPIANTAATGPHNMEGVAARPEAKAGWFIGQHEGAPGDYYPPALQKLFRLKGRGHGEWLQRNVKVSIEKIRQSNTKTNPYGTFSVVLRSLKDTDSKVQVLERFDNLNLNPSSPDYIARKIGDKYAEWDSTNRRLKVYGEYDNLSKFVYVEMNDAVDGGASGLEALLPFGYFGPPKFKDTHWNGEIASSTFVTGATLKINGMPYGTRVGGGLSGSTAVDSDTNPFSSIFGQFNFPKNRLRLSASDGGLADQTNAYFGFTNTRTSDSTIPDASVADFHRMLYAGASDNPVGGATGLDGFSYIFSLDDVRLSSNSTMYYNSGSRKAGLSVTSASYTDLLIKGYDRFTAPFWGGFDGFDITKPDPVYNAGMTAGTSTELNSYIYNTWKRAIDTVADPEAIDMNMLAAPGLTFDGLTSHMINVCEERADALALIDLKNVYTPAHESYQSSKKDRVGAGAQSAANNLKDRQLDSSYGATFYPWVQTRDEQTGRMLWIPPSVAMAGVLGSSQAKSDVWFAPAGFNRGGLSDGAAGIPVTGITERLTSKDRDTLYEARINPIASFPSSGIVVFGQKTLQERASALDRINVRRLVIYLKKQISVLSTQVLFEQNVQATWNRFKALIEPFLANVKVQFGITDYKLILDESTTTPDLIDQNILYAKIMIKPARAIEYIAIDFVIASTGASFDD